MRMTLIVLAAATAAWPQTLLKDAYKGYFRIGAALNRGHYTETDAPGAALVKRHFNTITPENDLKWVIVHPKPGVYNFEPGDKYVEFGEKNGMFIVGHCLVWHNQTPRWVFEDAQGQSLTRDALLERMREHIGTVVKRYKGRIQGWDVVNEALDEDGTMRQSPWMKIIGEDYVARAFEYAHEADPKAELYYNDYSLENEPKRKGAVELIKKLKAQGLTVTAIGTQHHDKIDWPSVEQIDATIAAFKALGVRVNVSELDVDVLPRDANLNPYTAGLSDEVQQALAKRYGEIFSVFAKHRGAIDRVTFWGVTDRTSWLNDFPARGRTNHPLLFDRDYKPKPAFDAVVSVISSRPVSY